MSILTKEELNKNLYSYYVEHYGEKDTDEWFEQPAVNVWVFKRDGKYISLKAHILSGEVEEFIESGEENGILNPIIVRKKMANR